MPAFSLLSTALFAQQGGPPKSPPAKATATIGGHEITITYSSPGVKGREGKIFTADGLIKTSRGSQYPIWRAGANSATTLHTDADLMIGDLSVPKGDYTLFVDISDPDSGPSSSTRRPVSGASPTTARRTWAKPK